MEIQKENLECYRQLTSEEKQALIENLEEERASRSFGTRLTAGGRTKDVQATLKKVEQLVNFINLFSSNCTHCCILQFEGIKARAGIEGFYCVVRNTSDFNMAPQWFFTAPELDRYLRGAVHKGWDPEKIGALAEAFSVAGCNFMSM